MLEELRVKNFLSFKNEICLNFEATKDDMGEGLHVVRMPDDKRLLRFALLYGPNASGKSNLLSALSFLREFLFEVPNDVNETTGVIPFRFDVASPLEPTEFNVRFYAEGIRYWYVLKLTSTYVMEEKLYYYRSVQPTLLFNRVLDGGQSVVKMNPQAVKMTASTQEAIQLKCLNNMSYFAARSQVNVSIPMIDQAGDWFRTHIMRMVDPDAKMFGYASKLMNEQDSLKDYLLNFVRRSDFNIVGMEQKAKPNQVPEELIQLLTKDKGLSDEERKQLSMHMSTEFKHKVQNERGVEYYTLPEELQSRGTRRALGIETAIYRAQEMGAILPIDEIESSMHPDLIEYILESFFATKSESQLLVTTHYDMLLDTVNDLIRKDSIWFTEKGEDGGTELYSLVEFKGLNKISSFLRSYRNGRFGAKPNIE